MTAHARLLQLRTRLALALTTRALLIGTATTLALLIVARAFTLPGWVFAVITAVGVAVAAPFLIRVRDLRALPRVALWVEERAPTLQYALVTIADGTHSPRLEAQALGVPWWTDAQKVLWRTLIAPAVVTAVVAAISIWNPLRVGGLVREAISRVGPTRPGAPVSDVLAIVHVAVTPPAYSGKPATNLNDPTSIEALVGSSVTLSGQGDPQLLTATADSAARSVAKRGDGWSLSVSMPSRPAIVRLQSAAGRSRLIVLAPIADAPPVVTLLLPAHDSIVRRAAGTYALRAQLRDDIGLRDAQFELVVASGAGENFSFRTTIVAHTVLGGSLERTLDARIPLDSLALKPGDVLQLRAVARDGNTVGGAGVGSSETRSLRIARADEYDSVAVDAAPPPEAEAQMLSQRMLINLTEVLEKRRPKLAHTDLISESRRIANDQKKLRKRVGDIVFQRLGNDPLSEEGSDEVERGKISPEQLLKLADSATSAASGSVMDVEGDETPILAINKPLLEAFNAMWDAGRALEVGEPAKALPPMRIALAAIQRARLAERIYLRGKPGTQIVDVAKVRLVGKDKGNASIREVRRPLDPAMRRRSETFERVTAMLARNPDAAADSLLLMRVDALGDAPVLAAALDDAARALRKRDNAAIPLAWTRVRRALAGHPVQRAGISPWQGAP
ncbi:MAG: hypothetical protein ABJE47_07715 [bacterium]